MKKSRLNLFALIMSLALFQGVAGCNKQVPDNSSLSGSSESTGDLSSSSSSESVKDPNEVLKEFKEKAVLEIEAYKDPSLYREEEREQLRYIINNAKLNILNANSFEVVNELLESTKAKLDELKTDAELIEEEKVNYRVLNGMFSQERGIISSEHGNSILVFDDTFENGSYSVLVNSKGSRADNGIVFKMSYPENQTDIWEGSGISYYFFFLSLSGTAYLGKTDNGTWSVLSEVIIPGYNPNNAYNLEVQTVDNLILCSVSGELMLSYIDDNLLTGNKYGLRSGNPGVDYSDINKENIDISNTKLDGFVYGEKSLINTDKGIINLKDKNVVLSETTMDKGTISLVTTIPTEGSNGLVFGGNDSEYYYFCVNNDLSVALYKISGTETLIKKTSLVAKYAVGSKVELKVTFNEGTVNTYIDDVSLIMAKTQLINGNKFGFRADKGGVISNFSENDNTTPVKADVVLWGHSHMQLWTDYKTDLSGHGTVVNLGIGGSNTPYWANLIEEIKSYDAKKMIVMTGSNDLHESSNEYVIQQQKLIYDALIQHNPNLKIILITEFLQPCRLEYSDKVRELNQIYFDMDKAYGDNLTVVDAYDIALYPDGSLNENMFIDIYHITRNGYLILQERVNKALNNEYNYPYVNNFECITGGIVAGDNDSVKNNVNNTVAYRKNINIGNGSLKATMTLNDDTNGGIFFKAVDINNYYYFAIDNVNKAFVLYKSYNGNIEKLQSISFENKLQKVQIKISIYESEISCFVNDNLIINHVDTSKIVSGSKYGIKVERGIAEYNNFEYESKEKYNYNVGSKAGWEITTLEGKTTYKALEQNQLLTFNDLEFNGGTIEFDMQVTGTTDDHIWLTANGLVIGAEDLYVNHGKGNFYVFGRCPWGYRTLYSKLNGNFLWEADQKPLNHTVNVGEIAHYKFVWDNVNGIVYTYVNEQIETIEYIDQMIYGNKVGIMAASAGTVISNISLTEQTFEKLTLDTNTSDIKHIVGDGITSGWIVSLNSKGERVYTSKSADSMLMFNDIEFNGGTIEFDMIMPKNYVTYYVASGVIFGADSKNIHHNIGKWYCAGRDYWNDFVCFSKDNGNFKWEDNPKVANQAFANVKYSYKFVWDSEANTVSYYLNGEYKCTVTLSFKTNGTNIGLFSESEGVQITNLKITNN